MRRFVLIPALLGSFASGPHAWAQSVPTVDYSQITRPVVQVTDSAIMADLLFELIIDPLEPPTMLQVIDVTRNGYGPDDIIVVYPSAEVFLIPEVLPERVQEIMGSWAPEVEFRLDSGNLPSEALTALIEAADTSEKAENAIMFDVVQAVERNYRDLPVGMLFRRDSVGFSFQLWDYNRDAMHYTPRPAFATDSAVASVVERLRGVGYAPGGSRTDGRGGGSTPVATVDRAILGIRTFPSEQERQLAARTVLLGSFDLDRSGAIDRAREIDAVPCDVWNALNTTFPGFLEQYGFSDAARRYLGSIVFSIAERVRVPATRRAAACLAGEAPRPTAPEEVVATAPARSPLPRDVETYMSMDAARAIIDGAGREPGSADWANHIRRVLLERFDRDTSGALDRVGEIEAIPCVVWGAIRSTYERFASDLGLSGSGPYYADRLGIARAVRDDAARRIRNCPAEARDVVVARDEIRAPESQPGRAGLRLDPATAVAGVRAIPGSEERQLAARTILRSMYDLDRSGYIDRPEELDAVPCDVWQSLAVAFEGFPEEYGFVSDASEPRPYLGSLVFNISARLARPAGRRATACIDGREPPPTASADVAPRAGTRSLPRTLSAFLATEVAATIARETARHEPGSAVWAAAVRRVFVETYDLDGSGALDDAREIDAIACVVWQTVAATLGEPLDVLGFADERRYVGDRIGIAASVRQRASEAFRRCPSS